MAALKPEPGGPALKAADYKLINQALFRVNQASEQIDQMKKAQLPTEQLEQLRDELLTQLTLIKQTYFPGQP